MDASPQTFLRRAEEHVFTCGVDDPAEQLCRLNMRYGLAKIHHYQHKAGYPSDATFIGAPDATVTRNENRWLQGIGYGGKIEWTGDFAVLDLKLNGCGVLMGRLPRPFTQTEVQQKIQHLIKNPLSIDGVTVDWDLDAGNHFLELLIPEDDGWNLDWKQPAFILHSSGHEHRVATPRGPGLYWDRSAVLKQQVEENITPWGVLRVLTGENARRYNHHCLEVQTFHMRRRDVMARAIFGDYESLFQGTHQGLAYAGGCHLGCYYFGHRAGPATLDPKARNVFPMTLSRDLPVFMLRPIANFSPSAVARLGWEKRIRRWGLAERISKADLLPHGAGYAYPWMTEPGVLDETGSRVYHGRSDFGGVMFTAPRPLPYRYRGPEVLHRTCDLGMAEVAGKMCIAWCIGGGR